MKPFYKDVKSRKGLDSENMVRKNPRLIFSEQFGFFFSKLFESDKHINLRYYSYVVHKSQNDQEFVSIQFLDLRYAVNTSP